MNYPIVMVAFGTTTNAIKSYSFINEVLRERFPDHDILWGYSSRMVKDWIKERRSIDLKNPWQVLSELEKKGNKWAVVQSLHLVCGHEFYRLVKEVEKFHMRSSIGLPLLTYPEDYEAVIEALKPMLPSLVDEAAILVGHGTDHPIWAAYLALLFLFREQLGPNVYVGMVEGSNSKEKVVEEVFKSGVRKVRLIPLMLVAGTHFQEDLAGSKNYWKTAFENKGISVSIQQEALGFNREIIEIFCRHIEQALNVIPV